MVQTLELGLCTQQQTGRGATDRIVAVVEVVTVVVEAGAVVGAVAVEGCAAVASDSFGVVTLAVGVAACDH